MPDEVKRQSVEDDDERHRREEAERRAKRKASKSSRPETEKDRQRKEYRQEILRKHGAAAAGTSGESSSSKRQKTPTTPATPSSSSNSSAFQELFVQRARGFQIDFKFRNAPPRPPVGPCFVGNSLDSVVLEQSRQYKPHNAVEGNHIWKLHVEPDLGVPLAPSAMDERSYVRPPITMDENQYPKLHPADDALLNWTGSLGDTAAEQYKRYQEQSRTAARLSVSQQQQRLPTTNNKTGPVLKDNKKAFSRVLKDDMQTWMKKTTYLSNDFSRKVHDYKSLAQTKSDLALELQQKQMEMAQRRTAKAITESFSIPQQSYVHPLNKQLKIVKEYQVLPDVTNWGKAFTHVVIDKVPTTLPKKYTVGDYNSALITNVKKHSTTTTNSTRMTCNVIVPSKDEETKNNATENSEVDDNKNKILNYRPIQSYDLDVIPLKEEDDPHVNFTIWFDEEKSIAYYIPIASRVQLSMGRPAVSSNTTNTNNYSIQPIVRRQYTEKEITDIEIRMGEVDPNMAEKHHITTTATTTTTSVPPPSSSSSTTRYGGGSTIKNNTLNDEHDDGEDDFGDDDDDDDDDGDFGGRTTRTIVAES